MDEQKQETITMACVSCDKEFEIAVQKPVKCPVCKHQYAVRVK